MEICRRLLQMVALVAFDSDIELGEVKVYEPPAIIMVSHILLGYRLYVVAVELIPNGVDYIVLKVFAIRAR